MSNINPGDWCETQDTTPEEFMLIAERFTLALVETKSGSYARDIPSYIGWDDIEPSITHCHFKRSDWSGRKLTKAEILSNGWDGSGTPPQGAIVEYCHGDYWERVKVAYASAQTVLMVRMDGRDEIITTPKDAEQKCRLIPAPVHNENKTSLCDRIARFLGCRQ